jgi:integrase
LIARVRSSRVPRARYTSHAAPSERRLNFIRPPVCCPPGSSHPLDQEEVRQAEAVDQDFLVKDPARKVTVPTQLRDTDRTTLTWPQLRGALSKLELRDRILLELDMTNALRPGELFALRWQCFNHTECTMRLGETVYKGKIRPWGKTRKSLGVVHVPKELADDLWLWKQGCPDSSPEAFIFPNKKGGFMDSNNYRKRVLHRLERELELPKLTFQVIRRTIATLAQKKGTVKDIQGVLRHSRIATTTDVYMQEIPESVQKTVDAISAELRLLPNLEEVTLGTSDLLPNATKLKSGVSVNT